MKKVSATKKVRENTIKRAIRYALIGLLLLILLIVWIILTILPNIRIENTA